MAFAIGDRVVPTAETAEKYDSGHAEDAVVFERQVFIIDEIAESGTVWPIEAHPEDGEFEEYLYIFNESELEAYNGR